MTTSKSVAEIAAIAADMRSKDELTVEQIRMMGASLLSQRQDTSTRPAAEKLYPPKKT